MAALEAVVAAVAGLLAPLAPATLAAVVAGPTDQLNEFPAAWVWPAESVDELDPAAGILEERTTQLGFVRLYVDRRGLLLSEFARATALVAPVKAAMRGSRTLSGLVDRFQSTGSTRPAQDDELGAIFVDVGWRAVWIEPGTYPVAWQ